MRGSITIAALMIALPLTGCIQTPAAVLEAASGSSELVRMKLPIHVVTVGFSSFDADAFSAKLAAPPDVYAGIRYATTGALQFEPLQYDVQYLVHPAPDAFAKELFAYAATVAEPGKPDAFLARYDRGGENRVCPEATTLPVGGITLSAPPCKDIQRVDAYAVEHWIAANRAKHALEFPQPSYTLFVLDSYTTGGLPKDGYHVYAIDDGTHSLATKTLRAWGGEHDFVYLDVGAAPNGRDYRPWANYSSEPNELYRQVDAPIWDLADDMPTFYENLARNTHDAVRMLWARTPIYPFEYAETYVLPTYVFIDPQAHANPASLLSKVGSIDYAKITDGELLNKNFADLAPWADVRTELKFVYLDKDDPGMAAAVADAKSRDPTGSFVDFGIVKKYIRENWETYVPDVPGARSYPTFAFILDAPSTGIYAYSDGDEVGDSFGVFVNMADTLLCPTRPPPAHPVCFTEDLWGDEKAYTAFWHFLLTHELGHSFGLMHPHDQFSLDEDGEMAVLINWLWDSTSTPMTYRHALHTFNQFDRDLVLRGNAVNMARDVLRGPGPGPGPGDAQAQVALDAVMRGDYEAAMQAAREAKRLAGADGALLSAIAGAASPPQVTKVLVPVGDPPVPYLAPPVPLPVRLPYLGSPFAGQEFKIDLPEGATAVAIEFREDDAPTHRLWGAFVEVYTAKDGDYVAGAYNNGYDKVVLLDLAKCAEGCVGWLYAWGGVAQQYTVTVTPYVEPPR